jgi:ABC-2 type transport system ATP-binding protein
MTIERLLILNSSFYPSWNSKRADEYLKRFSLEKKKKIKNLSRGMKLKLGLVVALASEPEFLILDDPTSGLDVPTRQDFLRDIIGELSEAETTILFSTHLVNEIEGIIDHLNILHQGNLIIDEEYSKLKKAIKRVRMTLEKSLLDKVQIDGVLTKQSNENLHEMVIYPWDDEKEHKLKSLEHTNFEIEPLTLEEIFVSFVSETS